MRVEQQHPAWAQRAIEPWEAGDGADALLVEAPAEWSEAEIADAVRAGLAVAAESGPSLRRGLQRAAAGVAAWAQAAGQGGTEAFEARLFALLSERRLVLSEPLLAAALGAPRAPYARRRLSWTPTNTTLRLAQDALLDGADLEILGAPGAAALAVLEASTALSARADRRPRVLAAASADGVMGEAGPEGAFSEALLQVDRFAGEPDLLAEAVGVAIEALAAAHAGAGTTEIGACLRLEIGGLGALVQGEGLAYSAPEGRAAAGAVLALIGGAAASASAGYAGVGLPERALKPELEAAAGAPPAQG